MANASFTRDEVILALDVLYSSDKTHIGKNSPEIIELCEVLQKLPIHPMSKRPDNFRNNVGVHDVIYAFACNLKKGTHYTVGKMFEEVHADYSDDPETLHKIALSIRKNVDYLKDCTLGDALKDEGFKEGVLLSQLHRNLEKRDAPSVEKHTRCVICQLVLDDIYPSCGALMQQHLCIPLTELDARKRYRATDYITVCPNCHAAMHWHRPWLNQNNCGDILR